MKIYSLFLFILVCLLTGCSTSFLMKDDASLLSKTSKVTKWMEKENWFISLQGVDSSNFQANLSDGCVQPHSKNGRVMKITDTQFSSYEEILIVRVEFISLLYCIQDLEQYLSKTDSLLLPAMGDKLIMAAFLGLHGKAYDGNAKEYLDARLPAYQMTTVELIDYFNFRHVITPQIAENAISNYMEFRITRKDLRKKVIRGKIYDYSYGDLLVSDVIITKKNLEP
ncbi:MAG: hypothetical protein P8P30_07275 [Rickettsiales bacterium]|nr:hypothetical protein [Rickettsiales bacterium]